MDLYLKVALGVVSDEFISILGVNLIVRVLWFQCRRAYKTMLLEVVAHIMGIVLLEDCEVIKSVKIDIVFEELPWLFGCCCLLLVLGRIRGEIVHFAALAGIL